MVFFAKMVLCCAAMLSLCLLCGGDGAFRLFCYDAALGSAILASPDAILEPLPWRVSAKALKIAGDMRSGLEESEAGSVRIPWGFRVGAPEGLDLLVCKISASYGVSWIFFILHDKRSGSITESPPFIFGKWMEAFGDAPMRAISFEDIDGDGFPELVAKERVHNGTMYNAMLYRYYRIDAGSLALQQIFVRETDLLDLWTEDDGGYIRRELEHQPGGRLKLNVWLFFEKGGKPGVRLGEIAFRRPSPSAPYAIESRLCLAPAYEAILLTASGFDDAEFLKDGYRFHY